MKVDFYRVEMPDDAGDFADLLDKAGKLPDDDSRTLELNKQTIRLQSFAKRDKQYECDMLRIRMNEIPVIASTNGDVKPIDLDQDEGIGEEAAFLYDPTLNVLVMQRNRFAVTVRAVARYMEKVGNLDGPILMTPVVSKDAIKQLVRFKEVRKFRVRLAGVVNPQLTVNAGDSLEKKVDLMANAAAPSLTIEVGMSHQRGSLPVRAVTAAAREVYRYFTADESSQAIEISLDGELDDGQRTAMDLLNWQMTEQREVATDENRRLQYHSRRLALRDAFASRQAELRELFRDGRK